MLESQVQNEFGIMGSPLENWPTQAHCLTHVFCLFEIVRDCRAQYSVQLTLPPLTVVQQCVFTSVSCLVCSSHESRNILFRVFVLKTKSPLV